jgi:hypothetical protein
MAYTGSKAISGQLTTLSIGATPTLIGEIQEITQSGRQMGNEATTNLQSTAKEFIGTLLDSGSIEFQFNRIASDAGQLAVEAALVGGVPVAFVLQEPKGGFTTTGPKAAFNGLVTESNITWASKVLSGKVKVLVSGAITWTPGT